MYNISTQIQTQIPTSGFAYSPAIYDNKIVWAGSGNGTIIDKNKNLIGESNIYMYDLSTSRETRITTSGLASNPAIYGDRIVWLDQRNLDILTGGRGDIYMWRSTCTIFPLRRKAEFHTVNSLLHHWLSMVIG